MNVIESKLQELLTGGLGSKATVQKNTSRIIERESNIFRDFNSKDFDVLAVGMNCYNAMGVGVLKTLSEKHPQFSAADIATGKGNENKLGTISISETSKGHLASLYIQFGYGNFKTKKHFSDLTGHINLEHFKSTLRALFLEFPNKRIALAQPGVGNNGTHLKYITQAIEEVLEEDPTRTIILYKFKARR